MTLVERASWLVSMITQFLPRHAHASSPMTERGYAWKTYPPDVVARMELLKCVQEGTRRRPQSRHVVVAWRRLQTERLIPHHQATIEKRGATAEAACSPPFPCGAITHDYGADPSVVTMHAPDPRAPVA
jgi:hypothetical protein